MRWLVKWFYPYRNIPYPGDLAQWFNSANLLRFLLPCPFSPVNRSQSSGMAWGWGCPIPTQRSFVAGGPGGYGKGCTHQPRRTVATVFSVHNLHKLLDQENAKKSFDTLGQDFQ